MKNSRISRYSYFMALLILAMGSALGQTQQKFKKTYPVNKDVQLDIKTQHTKLIFETWDRNEIEVEAYLETKDLSEEEISKALESWKVNIKGDKSSLGITSGGANAIMANIEMPPLESLETMTDIIAPLMNNLVGPMMESFSKEPLPPDFLENIGSLNFDVEAYERDGEKYLEKWEQELESKFGEDFEKSMEEWSKNFEKDAEKWSAKMEVDMEAWGEEFGKDMEVWAENFGKSMEVWGEQFGKDMEKWAAEMEEKEGMEQMETKGGAKVYMFNSDKSSSKAKRTMVIKMPKTAKLLLDVRYGEVTLAERTTDMEASLSHSKLTANIIDGTKTSIEASYTPVKVKQWNYGVLTTNYVKNCSVEKVRSLKLTSTSSDVKIGEIQETGIFSGTFSNLDIRNLASGFKTVDINLENSELNLNLPNDALSFNYTGDQSNIEYPSSIQAEPVKNYDSELINGFQKSSNTSRSVTIKAKYSDVKIQ